MTLRDAAGELDDIIARLDRLEHLGERAAQRAAPALLAVASAQWAAGRAPDGTVWPRNRDGSTPLTSLTSRATAHAEGATVVLDLPDKLRPHQAGTSTLKRRPVVPDPGAELPDPWRAVFEDALREEVEGG